jgi:hypothetical protein
VHPRNVFLSRTVRSRNTDTFGLRLKTFGLRSRDTRYAPSRASGTKPTIECTSRFYLAPEVICFDKFSACSDMFRYVAECDLPIHTALFQSARRSRLVLIPVESTRPLLPQCRCHHVPAFGQRHCAVQRPRVRVPDVYFAGTGVLRGVMGRHFSGGAPACDGAFVAHCGRATGGRGCGAVRLGGVRRWGGAAGNATLRRRAGSSVCARLCASIVQFHGSLENWQPGLSCLRKRKVAHFWILLSAKGYL